MYINIYIYDKRSMRELNVSCELRNGRLMVGDQ